MSIIGLSGDEQLQMAWRMKTMRFNAEHEPICLKCNEPVAWVDADPQTLEIIYVESTAPGARPLNMCAAHREWESGRIHTRHAGV